jgi:hypothetical protein
VSVFAEVSHHLSIGLAGPVLPADKSLMLLLGDGYIAGYFLGSVFLPDAADLVTPPPTEPAVDIDAEVEIWRRRWGIALALVLALIWVVGEIRTPDQFTLAPSDHDLFSAIPLLGIGGLVGALLAPVIAKRMMKKSQQNLIRLNIEHKMGVRYERALGTAFVCVYLGVWLNPW